MSWNLALLAVRRHSEGPGTGRGHRVAPTGPRRGGPRSRPRRRPRYVRPPDHPLQPLWGFRGPLRCLGVSSSSVLGGWVLPRYSPPSTHPVYPPSPVHPSTVQCSLHVHGARNSRFWDTVGEPRGTRTHLGFRVPDWLYTVIEVAAVLHGRLTGFMTVLTRFY